MGNTTTLGGGRRVEGRGVHTIEQPVRVVAEGLSGLRLDVF